jgi:RNA-directed DNA polymerase
VNTDAPWPTLDEAEARVLGIQRKLHRWATDDPHRRFDDLFNLVADPAFLVVAWDRVRGNRGARSAGVDGVAPRSIVFGRDAFLHWLRDDLKARRFEPVPVRERMIPKPGTTKRRRLGIPTARDRTVQAALKLVLEPIFEADFKPCSHGFRPRRRAQDAIAEIFYLASPPRNYEWVLEGDITACFDEIDHSALMGRVRHRIGDKRVLGLVKAFLKAGILGEDGARRDTITGTPQGGILSPLLANVALSALDEHFVGLWEDRRARIRRRSQGLANYRLIRYADDFVVMVSGDREHAQSVRSEVAAVLAPMGLRLSDEKTRIAHIDEGFDFLGWRIQRHQKRGGTKRYVYTYPSKKALASVVAKVRTITRQGTNLPLSALLYRLNPLLRGWTNYFRPGVSSKAFSYLSHFTWHRVIRWLRRKHPGLNWKQFRRRCLPSGWWPTEGQVTLFNPAAVSTTRYRYRGAAIPTPWSTAA